MLQDEEFVKKIEEALKNQDVEGFRCAAHTLQLAVLDALKLAPVDRLINRAREVMKILKNQTFMILLRREKRKKPMLCKTRYIITPYDLTVSAVRFKLLTL